MYDPKNDVHTTLASAFVHGTDATMVLTSATGFPATGNYIRIKGIDDDEEAALYEYTGISTNTLTGLTPCTLGNVESTAAHTFGVGSIVEVMFVAEYLRDLESDAVLDALFDANTILKADSDNTPAALTVAEQRLVGRITSGVITALTAAQVNTLLGTTDVAALTDVEVQQLANIAATTISAAQWGYVGALTSEALEADGTAGRILREIQLTIDDGGDPATLKCTVASEWNGDTIAETDDIGKDATTGDFTLSAGGNQLGIKATGLSGNALMAFGALHSNASGTALILNVVSVGNNIIYLYCTNATTGAALDLTTLVDTGVIIVYILYITDA